MKQTRNINIVYTMLIIVVLSSISILTYSSVARPYPIEFTQPDGSKITILLKGDESMRWAETIDGFTIIFNDDGFYEYAQLNAEKELIKTEIIAKNLNERSAIDITFLGTIEKHLVFSRIQVNYLKSLRRIRDVEMKKAFPTTGNRKLICILMGYTDLAFTKTQSDFNDLFNQVNYSADGAAGSVKDFYLEDSYNQLNLTVTVAGPYTAANDMAFYGANVSGDDKDPRALVAEAVDSADVDVNYADFDNDGDGTVDGVYIIYAGYGEEAGAPADAIWAHAWSIPSVTLDGVSISRYSCSAELRNNTGSGISRIGVICHEFGHVLGAKDFYDTDYGTGGEYDGTGDWDMMGSGNWNNDGITPSHHNPYNRITVYGWATATTLSTPIQVTLHNSAENSNSFYRFNTATANEYFLIENRQQLKFDASIPGHGMLIYHVDGSFITSHTSTNDINAGDHQGMYPVCANATGNPTAVYGNINGTGCPFPGTGGKTLFGDTTTPHSKSWAGTNTAKPLSGITENTTDKTVTFNFMAATFIGGGGDDLFSNAANWLGGGVPTMNMDIIIAAGAYMFVDMDYTCKTLMFGIGSSFYCDVPKVLTITGNILKADGSAAIEVDSSIEVSSSIEIANSIPPPTPSQ